MQQIIEGRLYDTEKAEEIYCDAYANRSIYITSKGNYFIRYANGELVTKTQEEVKVFLAKYNVAKYIELFGEVEEG